MLLNVIAQFEVKKYMNSENLHYCQYLSEVINFLLLLTEAVPEGGQKFQNLLYFLNYQNI